MDYYFTLIFIAAATVYDGCTTVMDPLLGGLVYHATAQLKILKYNLEHLDKHLEDNCNESSEHIIEFHCVHKQLESCIDHHQQILWFIDEYEECFSWSIFCQFTGSMLSVPLNSVEALTYVVAIFTVSFQILFYCHYGTLLYEENNELINAICMGPWYKYDAEIRKSLLIIMERSKRPLLITAGKVVEVVIGTFVSVLKTSYSLIAVFNNYN
ncbi:odorant receptor 7a-like [Zophobas morio]|uniref:odorant receptor 7a-like n=1 Tax=Zophobas morio TaxID=2755281 RepID=UPI003082A749